MVSTSHKALGKRWQLWADLTSRLTWLCFLVCCELYSFTKFSRWVNIMLVFSNELNIPFQLYFFLKNYLRFMSESTVVLPGRRSIEFPVMFFSSCSSMVLYP